MVLRNRVMSEACPQCLRYGQIKAHGYLRGYETGPGGGKHHQEAVRGLRFFAQIDIPTLVAEVRFLFAGIMSSRVVASALPGSLI